MLLIGNRKTSPPIVANERLATCGALLAMAAVLVVGVRPKHRDSQDDFVTVRRSRSWTPDDGDVSEDWLNSERGRSLLDDGYIYKEGYGLRFRPMPAMPRVYWHNKFLQQQQEDPGVTTTMATSMEPEEPTTPQKMEPTEYPMMVTTTPEPAPQTTTSSETPGTLNPTSPIPMRPSQATTTSTMTTIMKPAPVSNNSLKKLLLFGSPVQANLLKQQGHVASKSKGFLSLFEVIKFENTKCFVSMGDVRTIEGICYHDFECKSLGGISTELCGEGVGVCCVFVTGCGDTTNQAVAYFESPNYPNAVREMIICVLIVNLRNKVQQLRLDFIMFEMNRPTDGDCVDDQFIVSGQSINFNVPVLCGINTGQHIYVHVGNSLERKIYLSFFAKVPAGGRSFNIKISQLESDLAPDGCLQYYRETEGTLKSFNYDIVGTIVEDKSATYLNNLNYAICMERAKETCTVRYITEQLAVDGDQLDFQIANKDEAENDLVPEGQAGAGIFNCPDDFIAVNQVRLCGERFNDGIENEDFTMNAPVLDVAAGPIMLPFRSDSEYVGRGFRLSYKQEMCP